VCVRESLVRERESSERERPVRERESLVSAATNLEIKGDTRDAYALEKGIPKGIAKGAIGVTKPFCVYASASRKARHGTK
jgi:hypothetical protein